MEWYIPILIYLARICDVPIGTVRIILVIGGHRYIAACLGFFEVIIWVLAAGAVIKFLDYPLALVAYGAGFASGVLIGMSVESRMALGYRIVRVISPEHGDGAERNGDGLGLCQRLREGGYRVTRVQGSGRDGPVEIAFMVVKRRSLNELLAAVESLAPGAFVTVERVEQHTWSGVDDARLSRRLWTRLTSVRK